MIQTGRKSPSKSKNRAIKRVWQTLKTREKQESDMRIVASNGIIRHIHIQCVTGGNQGDQIRAVLSDITERKKIEQAVRESEQKLA